MAIYHLSADIIKRSKGQSAVACAAYRAGTRLEDRRIGEAFDYTRRGGVEHAEIMAPANAPAWMRDRVELWNAIEGAEKRKDAQLAREVRVALPHELSAAQRLQLVREFVNEEFVGKGMVADVALHAPGRQGDERNHHAHILLTLRAIEGDHFGKKCRDWNQADHLGRWRSNWADKVNDALAREGVDARIDHRSLAEQGIDRAPQIHLGPMVSEMERRGVETDRGDTLRAVFEFNRFRSGGAGLDDWLRQGMASQQGAAVAMLKAHEREQAQSLPSAGSTHAGDALQRHIEQPPQPDQGRDRDTDSRDTRRGWER